MALVLIVDDDVSITTSVALLLKQAGHASQAAAGPNEALSLLEHGRFGLVLQDMNFSRQTSGAEGLALLADIRARWPQLPVVLMTAWGSIGLAVEGMKAGASDFVTKPWTNAQLVQSIETALGLQEARAGRERLTMRPAWEASEGCGCQGVPGVCIRRMTAAAIWSGSAAHPR